MKVIKMETIIFVMNQLTNQQFNGKKFKNVKGKVCIMKAKLNDIFVLKIILMGCTILVTEI